MQGRVRSDPRWYKDAIFYELRVRSFDDSNGDGVGDFRGLTRRLDYLEDLGVTTLWLLPFYPSPLRDDGYDISDYTDVHPECGTLGDFKVFLREAHRRGLRVVCELVLNHTSDQHPWFQRARRAPPGSAPREFYVWSEHTERFGDARIIFKDFELSNWTWDPIARAYYWHRFYAHQPDLNYASPRVRREILRVVDFWLGLGVDGLRLDAVPYLFEREGTSCENLPETHAFLRELRAHVDRRFGDRMLLAEANQWPEEAAAYLAEGRECHMAFHFPLMPRLFLALRAEDRFPITDIWAQTPVLHESCQWALFLRNHDELTLEMVTDEERDFLYRAYASEPRMRINLGIRRRLAPLVGNNRRAIELLHGLLFSLPGTPVMYYGDEIGMGDNIFLGDRNGVRTPMQWSADRNAGFSSAPAQQLVLPPIVDHEYHFEAINVETQLGNRHSLLWWLKRLIALRHQHTAFGRGGLELLDSENPRVLAFIRAHGNDRVLVVANLSRYVQLVRLDLSRHRGLVPVELFGRQRFPPIGDRAYFFTLGPHGFYWFELTASSLEPGAARGPAAPTVVLAADPQTVLAEEGWPLLEERLLPALVLQRGHGGDTPTVKRCAIFDAVPLPGRDRAALLLAHVEHADREPETHLFALAVAERGRAEELRARAPGAILARLDAGEPTAAELFDPLADGPSCRRVLELFTRRRVRGGAGALHVQLTPGGGERVEAVRSRRALEVRPRRGESHASVRFGEELFLKIAHRLEEGIDPELETLGHLGRRGLLHVPSLCGWAELRRPGGRPSLLGLLQHGIPARGDLWSYTQRELRRFFERALARRTEACDAPRLGYGELLGSEPPVADRHMIGAYLEAARLLGERLAELHLALADADGDPAFTPEPYTPHDQRSVYQSLRNLLGHTLRLLRGRLAELPDDARRTALRLLRAERRLAARLDRFRLQRVTVPRIRLHGALDLGHVLRAQSDLVFVGFDGEPGRSLEDRRRKRLALRDLARTLHSFHRATSIAAQELTENGVIGARQRELAARCAERWRCWTSRELLAGYLARAGTGLLVPGDRGELGVLLDTFLLERSLAELAHGLGEGPALAPAAVEGILHASR